MWWEVCWIAVALKKLRSIRVLLCCAASAVSLWDGQDMKTQGGKHAESAGPPVMDGRGYMKAGREREREDEMRNTKAPRGVSEGKTSGGKVG